MGRSIGQEDDCFDVSVEEVEEAEELGATPSDANGFVRYWDSEYWDSDNDSARSF